jgi:glycosyltransferase involved in cell wall biosynthesis
MKIGFYTVDVPATLGGGFVLRDDLIQAAEHFKGRHEFEIMRVPYFVRAHAQLKKRWNLLRPAPEPGPSTVEQWLAQAVKDRGIQALWFNHFDPIYVDVPYILNIFDLQHRLQPCFPEVSANGQWRLRETVWAEGTRRAALVTVGSQEAKEQLCHFYGVPLENVWVLQFPTPQKAADIALGRVGRPERVNVRAKYGIKHDFLFYPAQFWPHKNHVNLLHALKLLKERGRSISLVLTGSDHGNRGHVEKVVQDLDLTDLVHFCGFVPYEDILSFYHDAKALAYVSFFGPENLPPLEAMALECPVILSDIAGVRGLHGDGPVLVEPSDPVSIAAGIAFILDNPDEVCERVRRAKTVALANSCERYLEEFQRMLDAFEPRRRCWP